MNSLAELQKLVSALNETNSSNEKKEILKRFPQCKRMLSWIYNPYRQFYVTSKNLKKKSDLTSKINFKAIDIIELLNILTHRISTGHNAIAVINEFIADNSEHQELIYNIIDKNLKTRTDAKLINKVWPDTIPEFSVALAKNYSDYEKKMNFSKQFWYASHKLDGVRVITIIDDQGNIKFFSRNGKEFHTLDKVREAINKLALRNRVFDGEMCIIDENGNENFADMIKLIRRKDFIVPNPRYKIFDYLFLNCFLDKKEISAPFSDRTNQLKDILYFSKNPALDMVDQTLILSQSHFKELRAEASFQGWEGLILRRDTSYEGKRSNDMLKVKSFMDMEFTVMDTVSGLIRFIQEGKEVTETMLSAIKVKYKNNIVSVGSGFSMDQRRAFHKNPNLILGKEITVKYFADTLNEKGLYSLRFPTLKVIHDGPRD